VWKDLAVTDNDFEAIDHVLTTTRAVRKRLDLTRPVPREVVLDCLRLAIQAPTGGNSQGWRWLVVDDAQKRAEIAALYKKRADPYLGGYRKLSDNANPVLDSSEYLTEHLHEVPVFVIPCIEGRTDGKSMLQQAGRWTTIAPATWSFMLAARSRGLGTCMTSFHLFHEQEAAEILGIPYAKIMQTALLPVAYSIGTDFKPARRKPLDTMAHWERW
jgi:nitroreductase